MNAARVALGIGANVTVLDKSIHRLSELDVIFGGHFLTLYLRSKL